MEANMQQGAEQACAQQAAQIPIRIFTRPMENLIIPLKLTRKGIERYFMEFREMAKATMIAEFEQKLILREAVTKATGEEFRHLFNNLSKVSIDKVEQDLLQRYAEEEEPGKYIWEFYKCSQQIGESVKGYAAKLNRLADKNWRDEDPQKVTLLKHRFIEGLVNQTAKVQCAIGKREQTMEQLIELAHAIEKQHLTPSLPSEIMCAYQASKGPSENEIKDKEIADLKERIAHLEDSIKSLTEKLSENLKWSNKRPEAINNNAIGIRTNERAYYCHHCGKRGHFKRECWSFQRQNQALGRFPQINSGPHQQMALVPHRVERQEFLSGNE